MKHLDEFADLKSLDPTTTGIDAHSPRARATLERVLARDPAPDIRPYRSRRRLVRLAVVTSAIAIAAVAVFVPRDGGAVPSGDVAYATWTSRPAGMSGMERADAGRECRKSLKGMGQDRQIDRAVTALAERRGDWALVILTGQDQFAASCMTNIHGGGFGSINGPGRTPVGPRQLASEGLGTSGGGDWSVTSAVGRAGSDIVGMNYLSPAHGQVKATVENGYFAFWVPGSEFDGLHPVPVRVTYRDGTSAAVMLRLGS